MATTTPADLADLNHDGSTPTTAITNEMAKEKGYPMHTVDGGVVNIVKKVQAPGGISAFIDSNGDTYLPASGHYGALQILVKEEPSPLDQETQGVQAFATEEAQKAAEAAAFGPEGQPAEPAEQDAGTEEPSTEPEEGQDSTE